MLVPVEPPPALDPPRPRVLGEPLPELPPAALPPLPGVVLVEPPPALAPPRPTVLSEPVPEPEAPAPAELPPLPSVVPAEPPTALVPPMPAVELDCAWAMVAVPARRAIVIATDLKLSRILAVLLLWVPVEVGQCVACVHLGDPFLCQRQTPADGIRPL